MNLDSVNSNAQIKNLDSVNSNAQIKDQRVAEHNNKMKNCIKNLVIYPGNS
ncbi:hypothetical protein EfmGK961_29170 (plasmid) [Enterococcus faecium]|nr:hypothetical protein EfmGK961_29170 [Enterococcus faecium]